MLSCLCGWAGVGYKSERWDVGQVFTMEDVGYASSSVAICGTCAE